MHLVNLEIVRIKFAPNALFRPEADMQENN